MTFSSISPAAAPVPRPRAVSATVALLWLGLVVQLADLPSEWRDAVLSTPQLAQVPASFVLGAAALTIAMLAGTVAWLNIKLLQRRNWARVTCLVSAAIELAIALSQLTSLPDWRASSWWLSMSGHAVTLAVAVLLTRPATRAWFGSR